jgi:hypothetical protein
MACSARVGLPFVTCHSAVARKDGFFLWICFSLLCPPHSQEAKHVKSTEEKRKRVQQFIT